jgi:hypothetical protein
MVFAMEFALGMGGMAIDSLMKTSSLIRAIFRFCVECVLSCFYTLSCAMRTLSMVSFYDDRIIYSDAWL